MRMLWLVAGGGALGSVARYMVSGWMQRLAGPVFPVGTLTVNVIGSCCIGLLAGLGERRLGLGPEWRAFLMIGVLGGFTTFSSFSYETVSLVEAGASSYAFLNAAGTLLLCFAATWTGLVLGRL